MNACYFWLSLGTLVGIFLIAAVTPQIVAYFAISCLPILNFPFPLGAHFGLCEPSRKREMKSKLGRINIQFNQNLQQHRL